MGAEQGLPTTRSEHVALGRTGAFEEAELSFTRRFGEFLCIW